MASAGLEYYDNRTGPKPEARRQTRMSLAYAGIALLAPLTFSIWNGLKLKVKKVKKRGTRTYPHKHTMALRAYQWHGKRNTPRLWCKVQYPRGISNELSAVLCNSFGDHSDVFTTIGRSQLFDDFSETIFPLFVIFCGVGRNVICAHHAEQFVIC